MAKFVSARYHHVSFNLDVPVDGAVALILKMQSKQLAYKLLGYDTLIVATPEKIAQVEDGILSNQLHR